MTNREDVPDDLSGTAVSGDAAAVSGDAATEAAGEARVADAVARLTADDLAPKERRRLLGQLAGSLRQVGFRDMFRPKAAMGWLSERVAEVAPRIPIRNAATLRGHFPGLTDAEIAERLVRNAARTTAGIGAVGGGVSAVEWAAPPVLLTAPVLLAAETLAVVAVEIKLIGELQEMYGLPVTGSGAQRAYVLVQAWAGRRGVNLLVPGRGAAAALGTAARFELRDRLLKRFGRNITTLGPLLTGAAVAAFLNRRATQKLGAEVREDLQRQVRAAIEGPPMGGPRP